MVACILDMFVFLDLSGGKYLWGTMTFRILGTDNWKWVMVIGIGEQVMVGIEGR